ncbi:TPA: hypothetical protein ACH3X2_002517 [Trebouxia sp. C0005]
MRHRRRARSPPGLTQEGDVARAQRRRLAAENRAARRANREDGQPFRHEQAAANDSRSRPFQDITNTAGESSRKQGGSGGPAAPFEQAHSLQQRQHSEAAAGHANRRDVLCSGQADLARSAAADSTAGSQAAA